MSLDLVMQVEEMLDAIDVRVRVQNATVVSTAFSDRRASVRLLDEFSGDDQDVTLSLLVGAGYKKWRVMQWRYGRININSPVDGSLADALMVAVLLLVR